MGRRAAAGGRLVFIPWVLEILLRLVGFVGLVLARLLQAFDAAGQAAEGDLAAEELLGELGLRRAVQAARAAGRDRLSAAERTEVRQEARAAGRTALASAYVKILGWHRHGLIKSPMAVAFGPLFVVRPDHMAFPGAHPGLAGRIAGLDPAWGGKAEKIRPPLDSALGGRET
jgi:hypothetical protein